MSCVILNDDGIVVKSVKNSTGETVQKLPSNSLKCHSKTCLTTPEAFICMSILTKKQRFRVQKAGFARAEITKLAQKTEK